MNPLLFWGHLALVILAATIAAGLIVLAGCGEPCSMFLSKDGKQVFYRCR